MMVRRLEKCGGDAAPTPLRERRALYPVLVLRTRLYKGCEEKNLADPTHCEAPPLSWPRPTAAA